MFVVKFCYLFGLHTDYFYFSEKIGQYINYDDKSLSNCAVFAILTDIKYRKKYNKVTYFKAFYLKIFENKEESFEIKKKTSKKKDPKKSSFKNFAAFRI